MTSSFQTTKIEAHRQQFPGLHNKTYFNFGGQGMMSRPAIDAIIKTHEYIQEVGPFSLEINAWINQNTNRLRTSIAEELATKPENITLAENVTAGCNIPLWGIDWQAGEEILMSDCEHPGVIATVGEISRRFGVKVVIFPILATLNQGDPTAIIEQHLTPQTRLVVLSHLLWNTGQILPLAEIVKLCHSYPTSNKKIQVLVDGAQSVGCLALNLPQSKVDYYAFTGHKWLCGPAGVGGLYISSEAFKQLQPTFIGWRGVETDAMGQPQQWKEDGRKFEVATSAYPEYEGLRKAIAVNREYGDAQMRYDRIRELSSYLWQKLTQIKAIRCLKDTPPEAGLVSFQIVENPHHEALVKELEKQGFFLRTIYDPDCIRACVHYLTLPQEIDRLVEVIGASF